MAPVTMPFAGISRLFQQVHLPQMLRSLSGVSPQDLGLALKRIALKRRPKGIPPVNSDFYDIRDLLSADERATLTTIRSYMEERVRPVIGDYWERGEFPHELVPSFAHLIKETWGRQPYAIDNLGPVLAGMAFMELARVDPSIYTFFGVHWGLAMGSIAMFGSAEQRAQWLPKMERFELLGSWSLTEPDVGSATAAGLTTTARREGDSWVLNGAKKWSGNAPFADLNVVWARDLGDNQVKGFLVERGTPGYVVEKLEGKIALRVVQNANITLTNCRVPEANRLQNAGSFRDVARQLGLARGAVAWAMTGTAMGAYEHALTYANHRIQFGQPIAGFQLVQSSLVQMLGNITAMQTLCLRMSQLHARDGKISQERASLAKAFCGEKMRETVALARNVLGGNGILLEYNVARFFADAEALYSYEGTHEMNTLIVGRAITGIGAFL
ncbi:acyl-CoA dehydrogenase family protein [Oscillochloris sp. ZM17-4]|uniref:acyl-CoA dehydrogenase family protein n=1 Tax=Oscillochloris sp. ZM17-4 TaxID=2866714 RepID=UPI001C739D3B|nr:acyl-CoA dehydrogenase family protein [Oscillochloris sp. ZM17-4]MBX0330609.1 acyl-CoA dehydrogenase family protein [Oscillochloris sp. ZM17-4]